MIWSPDESAVARVNANVTDLPVASGKRSPAAIVKDTPVTWPPRAGYPQVPARSVVVLTLIPLEEAEMGPPIVAPVRVMVKALATTLVVAATTYCGAVP